MKKIHYGIAIALLVLIVGQSNGQTPLKNGIALYQSKKLDDATKSFESVEKSAGDYATAQYYLGKIAYDKKEYDDAVDYFEEATELSPSNGEYFNALGDAYAGVGSESNLFTQMSVGPKAMKAWEKAAALSPTIIPARMALVDSYLMAPEFMGGGEDKAKTLARETMPLLDESLKTSPDNFLQQYSYGKMAAITGTNLDQGERWLLRYLNHTPATGEPSLAGAHMRLGQIKEKQGNKIEAKKNYEMALKMDARLDGAKKGLERVSK